MSNLQRRRFEWRHYVLNIPFFQFAFTSLIIAFSLSICFRKDEDRETLTHSLYLFFLRNKLYLHSLLILFSFFFDSIELGFQLKIVIVIFMATVNGQIETAQGNITTPSKQPLPAAKSVDSQSVLRRLQSELMALMMSGESGISAFPEEDNIFFWKGTITGSKDTVFEGTEYKLSLSFPNDYPFKPPKVKFETTCFHPNVDLHGNICLDILQDKWSSAYDVRTILLSIQSLLGEPNNSSPLNPQAAQLWSNQEDYRKMVEKLYKPPPSA